MHWNTVMTLLTSLTTMYIHTYGNTHLLIRGRFMLIWRCEHYGVLLSWAARFCTVIQKENSSCMKLLTQSVDYFEQSGHDLGQHGGAVSVAVRHYIAEFVCSHCVCMASLNSPVQVRLACRCVNVSMCDRLSKYFGDEVEKSPGCTPPLSQRQRHCYWGFKNVFYCHFEHQAQVQSN